MTDKLEVTERLFDLYHCVHRLVNTTMAEEGVSLARSKFLFYLSSLGPCRCADIASALGFSPRTVTEAIDGLERDGMVVREPDPEDRRAKIISITDRGRVALDAALEPRHRTIEALFSALDECERTELFRLLGRLRDKASEIDENRHSLAA
ncbi:MAG TPA: MarR family transcriptional regulator [Ensifer sp.]|jgi:DNA-binding MarR family transcriptional regulator|uniref:MarR family winged helix-turn-helix transcriptional regulator n=1 Tax=Ensifer sp. TaxID=1872086 RepID=UPI002E11F7A4|nr:MarR family transcriptional regulator [Ensifer sp.]